MTNHSSYRHPQHDAIVRMLLDGVTERNTATQLGIGRAAVARVRGVEGISPRTNRTTREQKVDRFVLPADANGHVLWTGRSSTSGAPVIRHMGVEIPASHVTFEQRAKRPPVGMVKSDCGVQYCIASTHITDELERRNLRGQERALYGLDPVPWDSCPKAGHPWAEHGRFQPDLSPYCRACNTVTAARARARAKARKDTA